MGCILTFYSYKGGVGRTMALANIAVLLAKRGLRVLAVDWDLEAPGLYRYFREFDLDSRSSERGLLDLLVDASNVAREKPNWRNYVSEVLVGGGKPLVLLSSGRQDEDYAGRVLEFDWHSFFREKHGGEFIESLRNDWRAEFDIVLIDSRTGITDAGGVCTIQLPDVLVLVFSANEQSLLGAKDVAIRAQRARQNLAFDRMPLLVFPLPSRFDSRTEFKESQKWLQIFARELEPFYADWVPRNFSTVEILERTKVPYVAFFSFGEKLPVLTHGTSDPEGLGHAYEVAATLIANDFKGVDRLFKAGTEREDVVRTKVSRSTDAVGVGVGVAIYTLSPSESIEVEFALETICQRRNGGARVTRDLLVKNSSASSVINRLRLGFSYPLVDVRSLKECQNNDDLSDKIAALKRKQVESVRVRTLDLLFPEKPRIGFTAHYLM
jgi:CO dehydrogenase nickel-insertion accessory protein CooC1